MLILHAESNLTGHFLETTIPIGEFPVGKEHFSILTQHGDKGLGSLAVRFSGVFDGITAKIRWTLDGIEVLLIDTPWPVVMVAIVVMAVRLAGPRVGDFTAATLTDLAFMGLWAMSMIEGASMGEAVEIVRDKFRDAYLVELIGWSVVQTVNFRFVPLAYHLLVVNCVTVADVAFVSWWLKYREPAEGGGRDEGG